MQRLPEWSDARTAALFLKPCTVRTLNEEIGKYIKRQSGNRFGTPSNAKSGGWRYFRHDLERVRAIMDALGCPPLRAAQYFHALKVCKDRELIEWLLEQELEPRRDEAQLDIDDQLKRRRKRRC